MTTLSRAIPRHLSGSPTIAALGLASLTIGFYLVAGSPLVLQSAFFLALLTSLAAIGFGTLPLAPAMPAFLVATLYALGHVASLLANLPSLTGASAGLALVDITNSTALLVLGALLGLGFGPRLGDLLEKLAVIIAAFLLIALVCHWSERYGGRFMGRGLHPNWWGSVAFGCTCCALFVAGKTLRAVIVAVCITVCLAASARGALLGIGVLLVTQILAKPRAAGTITITAALAVLALPLLAWLWPWLARNILLLDNPYRGVSTDFSGRVSGWTDAWDAFLAAPFFGIGFNSLSDVHNGYLLTLGESGLFGLAILLALVITPLVAPIDGRLKSIVLAYAIFLLFAPRAINLVLGSMIPAIAMMQGFVRRPLS